MKTLKTLAVALSIMWLGSLNMELKAQDYYGEQDNISLQTFYDELSPYGTWIQDPQYGYVWRPDVDQDEFRPYYTNGRWVMTEYGNTWVSNYDWGWAPFHYGRWMYRNHWVWVPDTVWGPAWVDWRSGDGYYGWAPMAPMISININIGSRYRVPTLAWNFLPVNIIYGNSYPRYYRYDRNNRYLRNTTIINNTIIVNNHHYYGGPRADDYRRYTNRNVNVYRLDRVNRPSASRVDNSTVGIYRPRPERHAVDNRNVAPGRFETSSGRPSRNNAQVNPGNGRNESDRNGIIGSRNPAQRPNNGQMNTERPSRENRGNGMRPTEGSRPAESQERVSERPNRGSRFGMGGNMGRPESTRPQEQQTQRAERPQRDMSTARRPMQSSRPAETPSRVMPQRTERVMPQRTERVMPQRSERVMPQRSERIERSSPRQSGSEGRSSSARPERPSRGN